MKPLKVFIVDDDPDFAEGVAITLEIAGHEVACAGSGEEAIRRFRDEDFDVTLMDVRMPGMNGVEAFSELRKIKPDAQVIMMTAYSVEDLLRRAIDGGALGIMHKPFDSDELMDALGKIKPAGIILVADDDPDFVEGVKKLLTLARYSVVVAHTGQEAVAEALGGGFDVLLLDLRMPVLNGLEVYQQLKEQNLTLPTIIVTGFAEDEADTIEALRQMSVERCLTKPITSEALLEAIAELAHSA